MDNKKRILGRISLFYWSVLLLGIAFVVQVVILQFFSPEFKETAQLQTLKPEVTYGKRGSIFTHDGKLLATSMTYYHLYVDFSVTNLDAKTERARLRQKKIDSAFRADVGPLAQSLAQLFNGSKEEYRRLLERGFEDKSTFLKITPRLITVLELEQVKQFPYFKGKSRLKSGLVPVSTENRVYPYESLAYRTIGRVTRDSLPTGTEGIELGANEYLCGKKGIQLIQRISGGRWMAIDDEENIPIEDGYDVISTLDADLQDAAETALLKQLNKNSSAVEGGTAIVMEVKTGEIRAMVNLKRKSNGTFGEIFNYAISETSPPGSTFKLATLISLVEDGYVNLNTSVDAGTGAWRYGGKNYTEAHGYFGVIPVKKAFEKSSNIAFAKLAAMHYKGKEDKFVGNLRNMGLGNVLKLQIPGENPSVIPFGGNTKKWDPITLTQIAIGYGIELAPIHTLTLYNAIANNGEMVKPSFVTEICKNGHTVKTFPPEVINSSICSKATAEQVREAMKGVVDEGTARSIKSAYYDIAGKTGTAQRLFEEEYVDSKGVKKVRKIYADKHGNHKYQASFAGFFPVDKPRYSVIVVLYSPLMQGNFYGGTWAVPVFGEIADKAFSTNLKWHEMLVDNGTYVDMPVVKGGQGGEVNLVLTKLGIPSEKSVSKDDWVMVKPDNGKLEVAEASMKQNVLPSVVNMGLKEALYILENMGLNVSFSGKGTIRSQSVAPGTQVKKGQSIYLMLES